MSRTLARPIAAVDGSCSHLRIFGGQTCWGVKAGVMTRFGLSP